MDPSKDIYHKEVVPFLARRKKRHARHHAEKITSMAATPGPGASAASAFAAQRARSHRSSSRRHAPAMLDKALWILVGGAVGVYLAALGLSFVFHGKKAKPATATAPAATSTSVAPATVAQQPPPAPDDTLATDIRKWAKAQELYEEGARLHLAKQPDRALEQLEESIKLSPNLGPAHVELATLCMEKKDFVSAEKHLRVALAASPGEMAPRQMLANVLASLGNYDGSLAAARWVLDSDPYSLAAQLSCATAYINLGQPAAAIDHLKKVVASDRMNLVAQNMLAQSYTRLGQHEKSLAVLRELQSLDASNPMTYYNLAVCYAQQHMAQQALDVLAQSAGLFDRTFVMSWMESKEFDPIRQEAGFTAFREELQSGSAAPGTNPPAAPPQASLAAPVST
jgi:Tfp pilus assembly protein PilF